MKIILIGLGHIATQYKKGLEKSNIEVVATVDISDKPSAYGLYLNIPLYKNLNDVPKNSANTVLIATPPSTHETIIDVALKLGYNIWVEKPGFLNQKVLDKQLFYANENNLFIKTLFHWQSAKEVIELKSYLKNTTTINKIEIKMFEPYAYDSKSTKMHLSMGNVYIDNHINILSMLSYIFNIDNLKLIHQNNEIDPIFNHVVKATLYYKLDNIDIFVYYDWTQNKRDKQTILFLKDQTQININHNEQLISHETYKVSYPTKNRLEDHYIETFNRMLDDYNMNEMSMIHKKLFEVL